MQHEILNQDYDTEELKAEDLSKENLRMPPHLDFVN
jgi:hypothetical protein